MIRSSLAVIVGILVWGLAATVGNRILRAALPGYSAVEAAMTFTLAMLFWRLALGVVASFCAGATCAAVAAPGSQAVPVAAGVLLLLFLPLHYSIWTKLPLWYHIFFLGSLVPVTLFGGLAYRGLAASRTLPRENP